MENAKWQVWLVLLFLSFSLPLMSQTVVTGVITNKTGVTIEDVKVSVKNSNIFTYTNKIGQYSINIPSKSISLIYEKSGYKVQVVDVSSDILNITMAEVNAVDVFEFSIEELLNVEVVTASKYSENSLQVPSNILVITKNDFRNRGYVNLYDVFYDIPGFDIAAAYSNETMLTYARGNRTGSFNERTMLMINGIESNILYCQLMNISSDFPLSAVKRIEIISGPTSAVYGPNVFSGIINIITEDGIDLENNTSKMYSQSGFGTDNTQFAEITYLTKYSPFQASVSYRRFQSDLFDISDRPGYFSNKTIIGNPDIWGPYAAHYPKYENRVDNNAILAKVMLKDFEIGYNHLATKQGNGSEYPYDKTLPTTDWKFKRDILYLKYSKSTSSKLNFSLLSTYQNCGSLPDAIFAQGWNSYDSWDSLRTVEILSFKYISSKWGIFQDIEYQPFDILKISGGVKFSSGQYQKSYEHGRSDQTIWLPENNWINVNSLFPPSAPKGFTAGNNFVENEWGVFLQNRLLIRQKLSSVFGIRYDKNSNYGDIFSPRVGLVYNLSEKYSFKTTYGTGFQTPAPRNLYGTWGGLTTKNNLKPDKIQALDFGLVVNNFNIGIEATIFINEIKNSILQGENLPTKRIYGAECKVNYLLPISNKNVKNTTIHFNFSYLDARYVSVRKDPTTSRSSDKIGDVAPHKFNVIMNSDLFNFFHINVRLNYVGERKTEISNPIEKIDSYFITNINLQVIKLFNNKLNLFMNVNNVFDIEYYHPGIDAANAGEVLSSPSNGWYSSRLPQPKRSIIFGIYLEL